MAAYRIELNGAAVGVDDLRVPALVNYGHFTSMQVRDGCVRGLDLHLARLEHATRELFGSTLDVAATRGWMHRVADAAPQDLSLRVTVFARDFDRERPHLAVPPDVLVSAGLARGKPAVPLRVASTCYQREAPHIKHVGTFGLFHQRRLAQARGFDDALFVDASGAVSEGSIWNIGFWDGERVLWPDAPALDGVAMRLLKAGLRECGVAQVERRVALADVGAMRAAFFCNTSCPAQPITCIDAHAFARDTALDAALATAWSSRVAQRI